MYSSGYQRQSIGLPFFTPFAVIYAFHELIGPEFAAVSVTGAALYLFKTMLSPKNEHRTALTSQVLTTPGTKKEGKRVAIIGAGPAGLVTAKECLEAGCKVTTYDSADDIGGEFANRFWPGGKLTSSPYVTSFSDFEPRMNKDGSRNLLHDTKEEYSEYMKIYAKHFKVDETLKMQEAVTKIAMKKLPDEEPTFNITVKSWKNGKEVTRADGPYDHIAFCIGGNGTPHVPKVPGLEEFKKLGGDVIHSADLGAKTKSVDDAFKWCGGKRVVGLGMGESMADIYGIMADELKNPPKDLYVAIRSGSWIIPRVNPLNGVVNDWDSSRLRYAMPKWAHNRIVVFCGWLSQVFAITPNKESALRFKLMTSIPGSKPCYKPATKSNRFISVIAREKAELIQAGIEKIDGKDIYFRNGKVVKDVDSLIFGTGFQKYDFFENGGMTFEGSSSPESCACGRFLRIFDPAFGDKLGFIGMGIRPLVGSIPTVAEIQARLFAAVVSGSKKLPPTDIMIARAAEDKEMAFREFGEDNKNAISSSNGWKGVTNWIPYMDLIAREVGCEPSNWWLIFRPLLAAKVMVGPMTVVHYRLRGPGAQYKTARKIMSSLPIASRVIDRKSVV